MTTEDTTQKLDNFYSKLNIALGVLAALLISIPVSLTFVARAPGGNSIVAAILPIIFAIIGFRIGYLRRNSKVFFYVAFLAVLILSTIIGFSFTDPVG